MAAPETTLEPLVRDARAPGESRRLSGCSQTSGRGSSMPCLRPAGAGLRPYRWVDVGAVRGGPRRGDAGIFRRPELSIRMRGHRGEDRLQYLAGGGLYDLSLRCVTGRLAAAVYASRGLRTVSSSATSGRTGRVVSLIENTSDFTRAIRRPSGRAPHVGAEVRHEI